MKWITALMALGVLLAGCSVVERKYEIVNQIDCDDAIFSDGTKAVTIYNHTELLLDATVESQTDATNSPELSPTVSLP